MTKRFLTRQIKPSFGGRNGSKHDRHFLYGKFRSVGAFKEPKVEDNMFTACGWLPDDSTLLGNKSGEIRIMNKYTGEVRIQFFVYFLVY